MYKITGNEKVFENVNASMSMEGMFLRRKEVWHRVCKEIIYGKRKGHNRRIKWKKG